MFTVVPSLERNNNGDNYYRITVYIELLLATGIKASNISRLGRFGCNFGYRFNFCGHCMS